MSLRTLTTGDARWKTIYDFSCACGRAHNPRNFAIEILNHIGGLCPYDQALVYFIDGNRRICDQYLVNINKHWSSLYIGYFARSENRKYCYDQDLREDPEHITLNVLDWENELSDEFVPNYIRARGLKYSCGFALYDLNGNYRTVISLDRVYNRNFSKDELINLSLAIPQLNNLHKNFYFRSFSLNAAQRNILENADLTAREIEIADLLCQGISPANISRTLYISPATTNKHIAHICKKLNVSTRQALLVRLLRQPN